MGVCVSFHLQHIIPFVYVLMSCKRQVCYEHIFTYIHNNICSLHGQSFTTDYEVAMRNAIGKQYPNVMQRCCWFHFCQAVKRNASRIAGFIPMIRSNLLEREIYYKLMCIPLLPAHMIRNAFDILVKKSERVESDAFKKFMQYFQRQWIIRVCVFEHFLIIFFFI